VKIVTGLLDGRGCGYPAPFGIEEENVTEEFGSFTPPHDTGQPDPVETDPAALNSAEDLDEDRLRADPLEAGMDPPERWSGADKYGTTPYEQRHPRPLGDRLAEEEPDIQPESGTLAPSGDGQSAREAEMAADAGTLEDEMAADSESLDDLPEVRDETALAPDENLDGEMLREAIGRGQASDEAGGSMASAERTPPPAE
jgi:hypothetical protein